MNDPLKKYIQDNRDDFDHLEPSVDILFRIKKELKDIPKEKKGIISLMVNYKWMVAASILIITAITYILTNNTNTKMNNTPQFAKNELPKVTNEYKKAVATNEVKKIKVNRPKKQANVINMLAAYRDLTDSTSASTRLAAVLNIQKSKTISYDLIDKLAKTLNHDSNSNVRLAALNLMSKYAHDSYVTNVFMLALNYQNDPTVQLGLIELLSKTDNPKLDNKLYALANDPNTFSAVKDQVYLVLLNQNKL